MNIYSLKDEVLRVAKTHHSIMKSCLPLCSGENVCSPSVRLALSSDFGHRYAGFNWSSSCYVNYAKIEDMVRDTFCKLFDAEFIELRILSGMHANLIAYFALTRYGDKIMALKRAHGGHTSYLESGLAGMRCLRLNPIPFIPDKMRIDIDATIERINETKPRLVILGAQTLLFPFPVREIVEAANSVSSYVMYDAAMVLGLIAGKCFQNPLTEGCDLMASSTFKTFPGPQGGVVLSKSKFADKIKKAVDATVSNFHPQRILGLAIALDEMANFGQEYAKQIVSNAKALASALSESGLPVLCEDEGFTKTHQVVVDCSMGGAEKVKAMLDEANIISTAVQIPRDDGTNDLSGVKFGTAEITRLGMKETEMVEVARLISDILIRKKNPKKVKVKVVELRKYFQNIHYCFDENMKAYTYFDVNIFRLAH